MRALALLTVALTALFIANEWHAARLLDSQSSVGDQEIALDPNPVVLYLPVPPDQFSKTFVAQAILAAEDRQFYRHHGVLPSFMLQRYLQRGGGGSTLDQQLVKNLVLRDSSRGMLRKWRELFLASVLDHRYSKKELLARYANTVYLGSPEKGLALRGVGAGAAYYFGRSFAELTAAEAATLAAMIQSPNILRNGESRLEARRNAILAQMNQPPSPVPAILGSHQDAYREASCLGQANRWLKNQRSQLDSALQREVCRVVQEEAARLDALTGQTLEIAAIVMRANGVILALVGTREWRAEAMGRTPNHAEARNSPASTVKPFLFAAAVDAGSLPESLDPAWCLARSSNECAKEVARSLGQKKSATILEAAFGSRPEEVEAAALGGVRGSETSLLAILRAYTAFMNGGVAANGKRLFSPQAASQVRTWLRFVASDSGTAPQLSPYDLFAKTGTGERSDWWIVSGRDDLLVGVWAGDDRHTVINGRRATEMVVPAAERIWHALSPGAHALAGIRTSAH